VSKVWKFEQDTLGLWRWESIDVDGSSERSSGSFYYVLTCITDAMRNGLNQVSEEQEVTEQKKEGAGLAPATPGVPVPGFW
jgi:hypothetical protein